MSDTLQPHESQHARPPCPSPTPGVHSDSCPCVQLFATPWTVARSAPRHWDSPSRNTGVGCHSLLQGVFPTQGLNPGLLHCRWILYHLNHEFRKAWMKWLSSFDLLYQITIDLVAYKPQKFTSHCSRVWKSEIRMPALFQVADCQLLLVYSQAEGGKRPCWSCFHWAGPKVRLGFPVTPCGKPDWTFGPTQNKDTNLIQEGFALNYCPKAPCPNTITLRLEFQYKNFEGPIQSTETSYIILHYVQKKLEY